MKTLIVFLVDIFSKDTGTKHAVQQRCQLGESGKIYVVHEKFILVHFFFKQNLVQ